MEDFKWCYYYTGIFMVWVSGYLSNPMLVAFLKRAKAQLLDKKDSKRTRSSRSSFIILLDNVLEEGEKKDPHKGQRFRTERQFNTIFAEADLIVHKKRSESRCPKTSWTSSSGLSVDSVVRKTTCAMDVIDKIKVRGKLSLTLKDQLKIN